MDSTATQATIEDKVVFLAVTLNRPGLSKRVDMDEADVKIGEKKIHDATNGDVTKMHKKLLSSSAAVAELGKDFSRFSRWLREKSLPSPILKEGIYMFAAPMVTRVQGKVVAFIADLESNFETIKSEYVDEVEADKVKLGPLFNASDYPTPDEFVASYGVEYRWLTFAVPERLASIDEVIYDEEKQRAAQTWIAATAEVQLALRSEFAKMVDQLRARLNPADGERRVLRPEFLDRFNEFLADFEKMDPTGDAALGTLVEQARIALTGLDRDALVKSDAIRSRIAATFAEIDKAVAPMIDKKRRAIRL